MAYVSYPAPVGGWNARDDLGNMPPEDAVRLVNWRPRPGYCETRAGTSDDGISAVGTHDQVGTITTFQSTFGDVIIFSAGDYLFHWTGGLASVGLAYTGSTVSGATFWDSAHFQDRLIMTLGDGTNAAQVITYDGVTVTTTALNITAGPAEEDIRGVQVHKGRAYYWETASQSFWYAAAGAYQGNLTEFDLGPLLKAGGALQMMVTLTLDGGGGQDDLAAFIFSSGEVLVYQGDDPGDAAAWELVGVFNIGQPVDPQAHVKVAGTELVFTRDGVVDLYAAFQTGRFGETSEFTAKITNAVTEDARDYIDNPGWQLVHAPANNCVILNIPTGSGTYKQYIRETDTGGWWECQGWDGRFAVFEDELRMVFLKSGDSVSIAKCFSGTQDAHRDAGADDARYIDTTAIPAFAAMRGPGERKRLTAVKPFTNYGTPSSLKITGLADFNTTVPTAPTGTTGSSAARTAPIKVASANGNFISYCMQTNERDQQIQWNSSTIFYEKGGPV